MGIAELKTWVRAGGETVSDEELETAIADALTALKGGAAADSDTLGELATLIAAKAASGHTHAQTRSIQFVIDGNGSVPATGVKGDVEVPFACTITGWRVLADQAGTISVGVWKDSYANFPPVVGDLLVTPAISSPGTKAEAAGLSHAVAAGDILRFNLGSIATITRATIALTVTL